MSGEPEEVKDISIRRSMSVAELVDEFSKCGGFSARYLAQARDVLEKFTKDRGCLRVLSFVGAIVATGVRGVIADMIRDGLFDVVITTCGALDHDIARSLEKYYVGDFTLDDGDLERREVHRVGSVLVPFKSYGPVIERLVREVLQREYERGVREAGSAEICGALGAAIRDDCSFLRQAYLRGVEVYVPGILDGAVGTQIWLFQQQRSDFRLNQLRDFYMLADKFFPAKRSGALIVGGGISKHHTLWWNQFKDGLDYAVYITTAVEYDGSLSGAPLREAITWRKVKPRAEHVTVYCDATIALPLLYAAIKG